MVIKAILVGILYWLGMGRAEYYVAYALRKPVVTGTLIGVIYGNVPAGLLYGASIQLMWMGGIEAGGNIPADQSLATCIAVPAAILSGIKPGAAVALAVPFSVLGVLINNLRRTFNSFFNTRVDRLIAERKYDAVNKWEFLIPWACNFVLYFTPVFVATLFGPVVLKVFVNVIPTWLMNGLNNAGMMLPALGFALTIVVMGKKKYIPFFVLGYFMFATMKFSMLTGAVYAISIALIFSLLRQNDDVEISEEQ